MPTNPTDRFPNVLAWTLPFPEKLEDPQQEEILSLLSPEDRSFYDGLGSSKKKLLFLARHGFARFQLARLFDRGIDSFELRHRDEKKFPVQIDDHAYFISQSHSDRMVALAFSVHPVGIDLQDLSRPVEPAGMKNILTPQELREVNRLTGKPRQRAFLGILGLKKALSIASGVPLPQIYQAVQLSQNGEVTGVGNAGDVWHVTHKDIPPDQRLALASSSPIGNRPAQSLNRLPFPLAAAVAPQRKIIQKAVLPPALALQPSEESITYVNNVLNYLRSALTELKLPPARNPGEDQVVESVIKHLKFLLSQPFPSDPMAAAAILTQIENGTDDLFRASRMSESLWKVNRVFHFLKCRGLLNVISTILSKKMEGSAVPLEDLKDLQTYLMEKARGDLDINEEEAEKVMDTIEQLVEESEDQAGEWLDVNDAVIQVAMMSLFGITEDGNPEALDETNETMRELGLRIALPVAIDVTPLFPLHESSSVLKAALQSFADDPRAVEAMPPNMLAMFLLHVFRSNEHPHLSFSPKDAVDFITAYGVDRLPLFIGGSRRPLPVAKSLEPSPSTPPLRGGLKSLWENPGREPVEIYPPSVKTDFQKFAQTSGQDLTPLSVNSFNPETMPYFRVLRDLFIPFSRRLREDNKGRHTLTSAATDYLVQYILAGARDLSLKAGINLEKSTFFEITSKLNPNGTYYEIGAGESGVAIIRDTERPVVLIEKEPLLAGVLEKYAAILGKKNVTVHGTNVSELEFQPGSAGIINIYYVLHYMDAPEISALLPKLYGALAPDGVMRIVEPEDGCCWHDRPHKVQVIRDTLLRLGIDVPEEKRVTEGKGLIRSSIHVSTFIIKKAEQTERVTVPVSWNEGKKQLIRAIEVLETAKDLRDAGQWDEAVKKMTEAFRILAEFSILLEAGFDQDSPDAAWLKRMVFKLQRSWDTKLNSIISVKRWLHEAPIAMQAALDGKEDLEQGLDQALKTLHLATSFINDHWANQELAFLMQQQAFEWIEKVRAIDPSKAGNRIARLKIPAPSLAAVESDPQLLEILRTLPFKTTERKISHSLLKAGCPAHLETVAFASPREDLIALKRLWEKETDPARKNILERILASLQIHFLDELLLSDDFQPEVIQEVLRSLLVHGHSLSGNDSFLPSLEILQRELTKAQEVLKGRSLENSEAMALATEDSMPASSEASQDREKAMTLAESARILDALRFWTLAHHLIHHAIPFLEDDKDDYIRVRILHGALHDRPDGNKLLIDFFEHLGVPQPQESTKENPASSSPADNPNLKQQLMQEVLNRLRAAGEKIEPSLILLEGHVQSLEEGETKTLGLSFFNYWRREWADLLQENLSQKDYRAWHGYKNRMSGLIAAAEVLQGLLTDGVDVSLSIVEAARILLEEVESVLKVLFKILNRGETLAHADAGWDDWKELTLEDALFSNLPWFKGYLKKKNLPFEVDGGEPIEGRLRLSGTTLLTNFIEDLVTNAHQAKPPGSANPVVKVRALKANALPKADGPIASFRPSTDKSDYLYVSVTNAGGPLPEDILRKIMGSERFTTKAYGTGLGLLFTKDRLKQIGGWLEARNNGDEIEVGFFIPFEREVERSEAPKSIKEGFIEALAQLKSDLDGVVNPHLEAIVSYMLTVSDEKLKEGMVSLVEGWRQVFSSSDLEKLKTGNARQWHGAKNFVRYWRGQADIWYTRLRRNENAHPPLIESLKRLIEETKGIHSRIVDVLNRADSLAKIEIYPERIQEYILQETALKQVDRAKEVLEKQGLHFKREVPADLTGFIRLPFFNTLSRIMEDLLINAFQAMPSGSAEPVLRLRPITVPPKEGNPGGPCLSISVANQGDPIPDDVRQKMLGSGRFTTKEGGTGLGLSFIREELKWIGGWMDVQSRDGMNEVSVIIPLADPAGDFDRTKGPILENLARHLPSNANLLYDINIRRKHHSGQELLDAKDVEEIIVRREKNFARHIITRFAETAAGYLADDPLDRKTILLFDVDETIGSLWMGSSPYGGPKPSPGWMVRPAAPLVMEFLRQRYSRLSIGLASGRKEWYLKHEVANGEAGPFGPVLPYLDPAMVYGVDNIRSGSNRFNHDPSLYGGETVTMEKVMGWTSEETLAFREKDLSRFVDLYQKAYGLYLLLKKYNELSTRSGEPSKKTWRAAQDQITDEFVKDRMWERLKNYSIDHVDVPWWDYALKLDLLLFFNDFTLLLESLAGKIPKDFPFSRKIITDEADQRLLDQFKKEYRPRTEENHRKIKAYTDAIAKAVKVHGWANTELPVLLQRVATARKVLEEKKAGMVVIVDNQFMADRLDELLQGKLKDEAGQPIDGYKLLNLEKYRGRVMLIGVGDQGAFDHKEIIQEEGYSFKKARSEKPLSSTSSDGNAEGSHVVDAVSEPVHVLSPSPKRSGDPSACLFTGRQSTILKPHISAPHLLGVTLERKIEILLHRHRPDLARQWQAMPMGRRKVLMPLMARAVKSGSVGGMIGILEREGRERVSTNAWLAGSSFSRSVTAMKVLR